jgi:hypothetical protein
LERRTLTAQGKAQSTLPPRNMPASNSHERWGKGGASQEEENTSERDAACWECCWTCQRFQEEESNFVHFGPKSQSFKDFSNGWKRNGKGSKNKMKFYLILLLLLMCNLLKTLLKH